MRLEHLTPGMIIPWGGDRQTRVSEELAAAFRPGDRLIVVQESGDLLRVPARAAELAADAVSRAQSAFAVLAGIDSGRIRDFFERFAAALESDDIWGEIAVANGRDVSRARDAGRSTTRLEANALMRSQMITGLRAWRDAPDGRGRLLEAASHPGWSVKLESAPLGVVGFVFEGRPNVFADAVGVVRGGNSAVFRIGSDALGTAQAMAHLALYPSITGAGLPKDTAILIESADRASGLALFSDPRLSLAVARGSGPAVAQLGAVARQNGVAASLHGTGGAWLVADVSASADRFAAVVEASLDRKVCNTLNVGCIVQKRAAELLPLFVEAAWKAGEVLGHGARLHMAAAHADLVDRHWRELRVRTRRADGDSVEPFIEFHASLDLGHEWEWEQTPELWLAIVDDLEAAAALFNTHSPRFIVSLIAEDAEAQDRFYASVEAAFVGDGFTRWVDGQYALGRPELGLSNWQGGRMLARGGILSGDGVFTVRARMRQADPALKR